MKWNVILQDAATGKFQPYNIFEYRDFRLSMENLFKKQYPEERFLKELDLEIHYFFWAKIEWEIFIATPSNYIPFDVEIMFAINFFSLMAEIMHLRNEEKYTSFRE